MILRSGLIACLAVPQARSTCGPRQARPTMPCSRAACWRPPLCLKFLKQPPQAHFPRTPVPCCTTLRLPIFLHRRPMRHLAAPCTPHPSHRRRRKLQLRQVSSKNSHKSSLVAMLNVYSVGLAWLGRYGSEGRCLRGTQKFSEELVHDRSDLDAHALGLEGLGFRV